MCLRKKNQNKEKPKCKNHRMPFQQIKIVANHKGKNKNLNTFTRAFKKKLRSVAFFYSFLIDNFVLFLNCLLLRHVHA